MMRHKVEGSTRAVVAWFALKVFEIIGLKWSNQAAGLTGLGARPSRLLLAAGLLPLLVACGGLGGTESSEDAEEASGVGLSVAPPTSERVTIDLSAGMPGQSHWRYLKGQDSTTFAAT